MFDQRVINQPSFTVVLTEFNPIFPPALTMPGAPRGGPASRWVSWMSAWPSTCAGICQPRAAHFMLNHRCATGSRHHRPRLGNPADPPAAEYRHAVVRPRRPSTLCCVRLIQTLCHAFCKPHAHYVSYVPPLPVLPWAPSMHQPSAVGCVRCGVAAGMSCLPACQWLRSDRARRGRSAPVVPPPPARDGQEWLIALQHVTASQRSAAPLGPNGVDFCTPAGGCTALIDTGTADLALPPALIASLLQLLGMPANFVPVGTDITARSIDAAGYPKIDCTARTRPGPTIDFQIQARR